MSKPLMSTRIAPLIFLLPFLLFANPANANEKTRTELQIAAQSATETFSRSTGDAKQNAQLNAIRAHLLWGQAEETANDRDRAIAAYSSAVAMAPVLSLKSTDSLSTLTRDALQKLTRSLRDGLPLYATDDVVETIAKRGHSDLWQPRRMTWQLPNNSLLNTSTQQREFLWTSGKVFVPPTKAKDGSAQLWRVPPMYANVIPQTLPRALKMDRVIYGYTRENAGANKGLWRQTARVFYASTYQTQSARDDAPRAEILCQQFLKVAALFDSVAGVRNRYTPDGVTSIYLSELASEWPNAAPASGWNAGAWLDSSPGDITLFRIGTRRGEAEWLRQLTHEYSHIVMPPFGPFAPPLETWGNGAWGETLMLLWAASDAAAFTPASDDPSSKPAVFESSLLRHVSQNALPSLQMFAQQGPQSSLRSQNSASALEYLQGLGIFIERAYGSQILTASLQPHAKLRVVPDKKPKLAAESLLSSFVAAANNMMRSEQRLPVYLGAALRPEKLAPQNADGVSSDAANLAKRASLELKSGQRISGWIYIPPSAKTLNIEGKALDKLQIESWKANSSSTQNKYVLDVSNRGGWQNLKVTASGIATIHAAWLEK